MAGHSKFKNIQFRKGRQDKIRSKLFSKLSRDITLAAKQGVPDPTANARLRLAIANAKAESMPKDNIDRAIKKALGGEADTMEEIRYEGFAPGGVGLIVEVLTDNRNRAAANVRAVFTKAGGNLGETGSVSFMFDRLGEITYPPRGRLRRRGDGGGHRGGRRGRGERRRRPHDLRGVRGPRVVAEALEAALGPASRPAWSGARRARCR